MNVYIERALVKTLTGNQNDAQKLAVGRLLSHAKNGLYEMVRPLNRKEAHDRHT